MHTPASVQRTYLLLTLLSTLSMALIWGINTLFLLDAGLSNTQAFAANAFFTVGQVLFEVPTGVVADVRGRRTSYALGALTLMLTTLAYFWLWQTHGPFWAWAVVSALLGLGYTFFSGATEAWLVDALKFTGFTGPLESVFAKGQSIGGVAMLVGSVGGGYLAQLTNLGVPYLLRAFLLLATFIVCLVMMKDLGFAPERNETALGQVKKVLAATNEHGWQHPRVRYLMLSSLFTAGVGFYIFYAMQPYLLELYGNPQAYGIAGLAAAVVASAQIVGGFGVNYVRHWVPSRTLLMIITALMGIVVILLLGLVTNFWIAIGLLVLWAVIGAIERPIRQAYLNELIPSAQRATVLSFDSLIGSSGGAVVQPVLGRVADLYGYGTSYLVGAAVQLGALPFLWAVHRRDKSFS